MSCTVFGYEVFWPSGPAKVRQKERNEDRNTYQYMHACHTLRRKQEQSMQESKSSLGWEQLFGTVLVLEVS